MKATVTFVLYTMAGSLLMLASIIAFGISQGTFLLAEIGTSSNDWVFLGLPRRVRGQGAAAPVPRLAARAYTEAPPEVAALLSGVVSKAAVFGLVWIVLPHFPEPVDDFREARARARRGDARLRVGARLPPARHPRRRSRTPRWARWA